MRELIVTHTLDTMRGVVLKTNEGYWFKADTTNVVYTDEKRVRQLDRTYSNVAFESVMLNNGSNIVAMTSMANMYPLNTLQVKQ